jgi:hypothetical protein
LYKELTLIEQDRPFRRPWYAGEANIKMHLKEIGLAGDDWILLIQSRI